MYRLDAYGLEGLNAPQQSHNLFGLCFPVLARLCIDASAGRLQKLQPPGNFVVYAYRPQSYGMVAPLRARYILYSDMESLGTQHHKALGTAEARLLQMRAAHRTPRRSNPEVGSTLTEHFLFKNCSRPKRVLGGPWVVKSGLRSRVSEVFKVEGTWL